MALPLHTTPPVEAVRITGEGDVLLIELNSDASFDALRGAIRNRLAEMEAWRGRDARLDLGNRALDLFDLRRLTHVLKDEFDITVAGVYCSEEAVTRFTERELKLKVYTRPTESPTLEDTETVEETEGPGKENRLVAVTPSVVQIRETNPSEEQRDRCIQ